MSENVEPVPSMEQNMKELRTEIAARPQAAKNPAAVPKKEKTKTKTEKNAAKTVDQPHKYKFRISNYFTAGRRGYFDSLDAAFKNHLRFPTSQIWERDLSTMKFPKEPMRIADVKARLKTAQKLN